MGGNTKEKEQPLTKKEFERILKKAAQPKKQPDSEEKQTSESHLYDGCSGMSIHSCMTADT